MYFASTYAIMKAISYDKGAEMRKNELICLGLIYSKPNYVYALDHAITTFKMDEWVRLSRSSIYNTLIKLVKNEYASMRVEKSGNMPDRKVYAITEKGRLKLHDEIVKIIENIGTTENLFYLSVGFFFDINSEEAKTLLAARIEKFEKRISELEKSLEDARVNKQAHIIIQCKAGIKHSLIEMELINDILEIYEEMPEYFHHGLLQFYQQVVFADKDK